MVSVICPPSLRHPASSLPTLSTPRGPWSARLFIPPGSILSYTLQTRRAPFTQHNNPLCPWRGTQPLPHSWAQRHLSNTPFYLHTRPSIHNKSPDEEHACPSGAHSTPHTPYIVYWAQQRNATHTLKAATYSDTLITQSLECNRSEPTEALDGPILSERIKGLLHLGSSLRQWHIHGPGSGN